MRHFGVAAVLLSALILLPSCRDGSRLPRGEFKAADAFDRVFTDVWGVGTDELHSMMVIKDGKVIYERYSTGHTPEELHILWSASKTFTAAAVGFAEQDGLLSVEDKVVSFFSAEELPANPSPWLSQITVRDLLTMSSGLQCDDYNHKARRGELGDWAVASLAAPMVFEPGSRFDYNSMDSYLLSVIVSRVCGKAVDEYLAEKLFAPLGITKWEWDRSPQGYNAGGWGLYLRLEDFAKMGQFMLQRGEWNGRQLLSREWFDRAMSPQIMQYKGMDVSEEWIEEHRDDEWNRGYGYQLWCCTHGAYRLDGAWGQFSIIIPSKNAVVTAFMHSGHTGVFLRSVWDNIYDNL